MSHWTLNTHVDNDNEPGGDLVRAYCHESGEVRTVSLAHRTVESALRTLGRTIDADLKAGRS